jgi:hypothetical protein
MKTKTSMSILLVASGTLALSVSSRAQDHREEHRMDHEERRDDRRNGVVAAPPAHAPPGAVPAAVPVAPPGADPNFGNRMRALEEQRRRERDAQFKNQEAWNASRARRAEAHRAELAGTWGNVVNDPGAKAELATHADRMARLNRVLDIAEQNGDNALAARCRADIQKETDRDGRMLDGIRSRGGR